MRPQHRFPTLTVPRSRSVLPSELGDDVCAPWVMLAEIRDIKYDAIDGNPHGVFCRVLVQLRCGDDRHGFLMILSVLDVGAGIHVVKFRKVGFPLRNAGKV